MVSLPRQRLYAPFTLQRLNRLRAWRVISLVVVIALIAQTTYIVQTLPGGTADAAGKSAAAHDRQSQAPSQQKKSNDSPDVSTPTDTTLSSPVGTTTATSSADTGSFKVDLQQWADRTPANWQHGDLNKNNSSYQEGDSVPFRLDLPEVTSGSDYVLRVRYDFEKSGKNAYDYLTTFDRSRIPVPVPAGSPITIAIPTDSDLPFSQIPGAFSLWGGTFAGPVNGPVVDVHEKYYEFTVHATTDSMTLLWSGHLASASDWGAGLGAGSINGAPFHMAISRVIGDRETSSQDRSIHLEQQLPEFGELKLIKIVSGGDRVSSDWMLHVQQHGQDVANSPAAGSVSGTTYTLKAGSYSISESGPSGYTAGYSSNCSNGKVTVVANQSVACTVTNTRNDIPNTAPAINLEKTGPAVTTAGKPLTYSLAWSVTDKATVSQAIITDPLPAHTSFISASDQGVFSTDKVTWNLGSKQPGDHGLVTVTVQVASPLANGTTLANTACFDTIETDQVCSTATTTVTSDAALTITKSNNIATFTNPGQSVIYTVVVTNGSSATADAQAVQLTDVLPSGFTFTAGGGSMKTFDLGTLAPGQSVTTTYVATISDSQTAGTYTNTATAKGSNTSAVTATSKVEVRVPQTLGTTATPTLTISKTVAPTLTTPGKTVAYSLTITNTSAVAATNIKIVDTLPKGFTYLYSGEAHMTWTLDKLLGGRSITIPYTAFVGQNVKAGNYTNVAVVTADGVAPQKAQATVTIKVPQVLGLAVTGVGMKDYLLFFLGLIGILSGGFWIRQLRRETTQGKKLSDFN